MDISDTRIEKLDGLPVSNLTRLRLSNTQISDISVLEDAVEISVVDGEGSLVDSLNWLLGKKFIRELNMVGTRLAGEVDLSSNRRLKKAYLSKNKITKITVGPDKTFGAGRLEAYDNEIDEIKDIEPNSYSYFYLANNQLENLDFVPKGDSIVYLDVSGNEKMTNFDRLNQISVIGGLHLPYIPGLMDENHEAVKRFRAKNIDVRFSREYTSSDIKKILLNRWPEIAGRQFTRKQAYYLVGFVREISDDSFIRKNLIQDMTILEPLVAEIFIAEGDDYFVFNDKNLDEWSYSFLVPVSK